MFFGISIFRIFDFVFSFLLFLDFCFFVFLDFYFIFGISRFLFFRISDFVFLENRFLFVLFSPSGILVFFGFGISFLIEFVMYFLKIK